MKRIFILVVLLIVALHPQPTVAQTASKCDLTSVFAASSSLKSSGDTTADMAALLKIADAIHAANIDCNGFSFKGTGSKIVGPVELKDGIVQVTGRTKPVIAFGLPSTYFSGDAMDGDCGQDSGKTAVFSRAIVDPGAAVVLFTSKACKLILKTDMPSDSAWTITIEPLTTQ